MATPRSRTRSPGVVKYAYMFSPDKSPTRQFDAMLRAIAGHIMSEIGDRRDPHLTPKKLAAFYQAVGGDYDPLFLSTPHETISYMWTVTGCQHSLQPGPDDYAPPSVPALTKRGFSRWESVEILLGPEEHVPFIQYAVRNWRLTHPETGEAFAPDLPADLFPLQADAEIDRWHKTCAEQMRAEANREEESMKRARSGAKPQSQPQQQQQQQQQQQRQQQQEQQHEPQPRPHSQSRSQTMPQSQPQPPPQAQAQAQPQPHPQPQPQPHAQPQSQPQPQQQSQFQSKSHANGDPLHEQQQQQQQQQQPSPPLPQQPQPQQQQQQPEQQEQTQAPPRPQSQSKSEAKPEPTVTETKYYVHTSRDPFQSSPPRTRVSDESFLEKPDRPVTYGYRVGRTGTDTTPRSARQSPDKRAQRTRLGDEPRRRSFSDYGSPGQGQPKREHPHHSYSGSYLSPGASRARQQSQPRQHSSDDESSADESSPEHVEIRPRRKPRNAASSPTTGFRTVAPPSAPVPPPAASDPLPAYRSHRSEIRPDDTRRRSSPLDSIREKLPDIISSIATNGLGHAHGSDRTRSRSRASPTSDSIRSLRSREQVPSSRLSQNFSDLASEASSDGEPTGSERQRRTRERDRERERERERERDRDRDRERERERERERDRYRGRERNFDRERGSERESSGQRGDNRPYSSRRPDTERRPSSHTDTDRRQPISWEREGSLRGREHLRDERKRWERRATDDDLNTLGGIIGRRFNEATTYG